MYTIKQLEAFRASAVLGSFSAASRQLFTTQSTVAKRIGELEGVVGRPLFVRSGRTLRLTESGQRLLYDAGALMESHEKLLRSLSDPARYEGRLRIGATELVGLTWLPLLIQSIRQQYPAVTIEPEIDGGVRPYERLERNEIDLAIMPGSFSSPSVDSVFIGEVENVWMAAPALVPGSGAMTPAEVSAFPVIVQPTNSALTLLYQSWFETHGFDLQQTLTCNSLGMVAQLTIYGLGLSYLPRLYFAPLVADGRLRILDVSPALPSVQYSSFFRRKDTSPIVVELLDTVRDICDFSLLRSDLL